MISHMFRSNVRSRLLTIIISLLTISASSSYVQSQYPEWMSKILQIKPIKDDRNKVRSLFGEPAVVEGERDFFHLSNGKLTVEYSVGECGYKNLDSQIWRTKKDTVTEVSFLPNMTISFNSLNLRLNGFKRTYEADTPALSVFQSDRLGQRYVRYRYNLNDFTIFPGSEHKSLICTPEENMHTTSQFR